MSQYVRKIDKAKWAKTDAVTKDVAADAITNCLNTRNNELSLWKVDDATDAILDEVFKSIIATFTSGVDTFDVVIFEEAELPATITAVQTTPTTVYPVMHKNHYDIVNLTISKLSALSAVIYSKIGSKSERRVTRATAKGLIRKAIEDDPSLVSKLHTSITNSL